MQRRSEIAIPKRLQHRPRWKDLPVPYIALIKPNGDPDFRVTDEDKRAAVIRLKLCQLCGEPLGKYFFFTGGTLAAEQNAYFEPAAHLDCLAYAMQVCPFIVGKMEHADIEKIQKANPEVVVTQDDTYESVRNPLWVIKKATGWNFIRTGGGTILLSPIAVKQTTPLHPETMTASDWLRTTEFLLEG